MKSFPILAIGIALLWSAVIAEENNQPSANVKYFVEYIEDQETPGKWYTSIQVVVFGELIAPTEMTTSWIEILKKDVDSKMYVFARQTAYANERRGSTLLFALFPGIHKDIAVGVGYELHDMFNLKTNRVILGRQATLEELDASVPMKMIPVPAPEQHSPPAPKPEAPAKKERKSPRITPPRNSISEGFRQALIG